MIDINLLSEELANHIKNLPARKLVAVTRTAFESWFRVELACVLQRVTTGTRLIFNFNYTLEGCQNLKADICLLGEDSETTVFELKSFVSGADANKKESFPKQNNLLYQHVKENQFSQGVSFVTFIGYSDRQIKKMLSLFYAEKEWQVSESKKMGADNTELQFYLASVGS